MKKISRPVFVVLLAIAAALLIAAASLIIISLTRDGGKTVDDALWNYEKGCMLYDSERIVKYSSDYRRYELAANRESTRSALIETLDKSYSKSTCGSMIKSNSSVRKFSHTNTPISRKNSAYS